jgi:hypothetical protein
LYAQYVDVLRTSAIRAVDRSRARTTMKWLAVLARSATRATSSNTYTPLGASLGIVNSNATFQPQPCACGRSRVACGAPATFVRSNRTNTDAPSRVTRTSKRGAVL